MSGAALVEAKALARHYEVRRGLLRGRATLKALDGVSFTLDPGKTLAVVGESGCGKTTLARQLTLIEPPTSGHLYIEGRDVASATKAEIRVLRRKIQIVFQDPFSSLNPRKKVGAIIEEPLVINSALSRAERAEWSRDMMAKVGLRPEHYDRYPHMFSGGQRQRIAIARALVLNPSLVVADEPVSALDVSIQAQALNLLMDLQDEFRLAYVFISHDLSVVRHIADEVMVMYLGRPVEQGPVEAIFGAARHPYTKALLASTPHVDPRQRTERVRLEGELPSPLDPPPGCAFNTRCPFATEECVRTRPELRPVDGRLVACHHAETIG
ncbi:MAG: ABC transporter ATP-binding protein [Proteobacteria bacterium]|nr:ABC transporter ATP-binding protein [Pseudomonadota bacterium]